jgi:hypothetical protein
MFQPHRIFRTPRALAGLLGRPSNPNCGLPPQCAIMSASARRTPLRRAGRAAAPTAPAPQRQAPRSGAGPAQGAHRSERLRRRGDSDSRHGDSDSRREDGSDRATPRPPREARASQAVTAETGRADAANARSSQPAGARPHHPAAPVPAPAPARAAARDPAHPARTPSGSRHRPAHPRDSGAGRGGAGRHRPVGRRARGAQRGRPAAPPVDGGSAQRRTQACRRLHRRPWLECPAVHAERPSVRGRSAGEPLAGPMDPQGRIGPPRP